MRIKQSELKPGMHVLKGTPWPAALDFDHLRLVAVTHQLDGNVTWENRVTSNKHGVAGLTPLDRQGKQEIVVPSPPPRVMMSWDEDSETWAILVDTTNGSGRSKLNICLNDAELFDGSTDPDDEEPEPRMVSAGLIVNGEQIETQRIEEES